MKSNIKDFYLRTNIVFKSPFQGPFHRRKARCVGVAVIIGQIWWLILFHLTTAYYWIGIATFPLAAFLALATIWIPIAVTVAAMMIAGEAPEKVDCNKSIV